MKDQRSLRAVLLIFRVLIGMVSTFYFVGFLVVLAASTVELFYDERFTKTTALDLWDFIDGVYWGGMFVGMLLAKGKRIHTGFLILRLVSFLYLAGAFLDRLTPVDEKLFRSFNLYYFGSVCILLCLLIIGSMFSRQYVKLLEENV